MKLSTLMLTFLFALCASSFAYCSTRFLSVPYENIFMNPGDVLEANYAFAKHPIIFCYDNTVQNSIANVQWPYKGQIMSSSLAISLKTKSQFQGEFADESGVITITNTTNHFLIVNCQYGF